MVNVIHNFLSASYQNLLERELMSEGFALYMAHKGTVDVQSYCAFPNETMVETPQLTHTFLDAGLLNHTWGIVSPIAFKFVEQLDEDYIAVKAKMNINFPNHKFGIDNHYCPHVDFNDTNCITAIYYVNDSDGDTFFFNKNDDTLEVTERISPKKGSLVYFDSTTVHAGSAPKNNDLRCVVNFNFKKVT
jgi:hypothetical protein